MAIAGITIGIAIGAAALEFYTIAFTLIVSAALGVISRHLMARKPKATQSSFSDFSKDRTLSFRQPITTQKIIYGRMRVGGPIIFLESSGDSNEFLHMIVSLGTGGEYDSIEEVWLDEIPIYDFELDASGNVISGNFTDLVRIKKHLGAYNQSADSDLTSETLAGTNFKGGGIAYIYLRLKFNNDVFIQVPNITAIVKGRKIYDPRVSPSQDPNDPDTWEWSDNAALIALDYIRGVPAKNSSGDVKKRYGLVVDDDYIDMDSFITAANVCDEPVPLVGSPETQELRYRANGVVDTIDDPDQILIDLKTSFAGDFFYSSGVWSIQVGEYVPPGGNNEITADNLRAPIQVQTKVSRRELFNAVKGVFISENHFWQPMDYPPVTNLTYETEDNSKRIWGDFAQPYQISPSAAQRIAKIELEKHRKQILLLLQCNLSVLHLSVGDAIELTYDRFGWDKKIFQISNWKLVFENDENGTPIIGIDLEVREYDSTIFDWSAEENALGGSLTINLPDALTVANPTSLFVETIDSQTEANDIIRQISIGWVSPADQFVVSGGSIEVQWKLSGSSSWQPSFFVAGDINGVTIPAIFEFGTLVDVRVRSLNTLGVRASTWQTELEYSVGSTRAGVDARVDYRFIYEALGSPDLVDYGDITDGSPGPIQVDFGDII